MSIHRAREYPTKQQFESTDDYVKRLRNAIQEESSDRIQDFDILQLGNVPWIDVREYGAKVDGSTDDKTAIDAAIAALPATGGTILIPEGTLLSSGPITITKPSVRIVGINRDTSIIEMNSANALISVQATTPATVDGFHLSNLTLDGNTYAGSGDLLTLTRARNFLIDNVVFKDSTSDGIYVNGDNDGAAVSADGIIRNCRFIDNTSVGLLVGKGTFWLLIDGNYFEGKGLSWGGDCAYCQIVNNRFRDITATAINIQNSNYDCYLLIDGNILKNVTGTDSQGILSSANCHKITMTNNIMHHIEENGINVGGNYNICSNNFIYDCFGSDAVDACGIENGGIGCTITNNVVAACQRTGILGLGIFRSVIANNVLINNGQNTANEQYLRAGICIKTNVSDHVSSQINLIKGNICMDTQVTNTQRYGIIEKDDDATGGVVVSHNIFTDNYVKNLAAGDGTIVIEGASSEAPNNYTDDSVDIASASTITLLNNGDYFNITGTTNITSVTASWAKRRVVLKFAGILTFTDGSNLKLAGNLVTTADDTIALVCDGTNWYEESRSVN